MAKGVVSLLHTTTLFYAVIVDMLSLARLLLQTHEKLKHKMESCTKKKTHATSLESLYCELRQGPSFLEFILGRCLVQRLANSNRFKNQTLWLILQVNEAAWVGCFLPRILSKSNWILSYLQIESYRACVLGRQITSIHFCHLLIRIPEQIIAHLKTLM